MTELKGNLLTIHFSASEILPNNRLFNSPNKEGNWQCNYVLSNNHMKDFFGGYDKMGSFEYSIDLEALDQYKRIIESLSPLAKKAYKNNMTQFSMICETIKKRKIKSMFSPDSTHRAIIFNKKNDVEKSDYDIIPQIFYEDISMLELEKKRQSNNSYT